nr:aminopeptidase P family N-terminal domain-containing protein [Lysinibacillus mangiferihumi]
MDTIYGTRKAILKSKLEVDIAFITSPSNIFYYTGFLSNPHERFMALVFNTKTNKEILYVPALDLDAAEQVAHIQHIVPITDEQMPFEVVKNTIGNLGSTAGVEAKALTLSRYLELTNALNVQVKDI